MRQAISWSLVAALLLLSGCGGGGESTEPPEYAPMSEAEPDTTVTAQPTEQFEAPPEPTRAPPPPAVQVVEAENTPLEGNAPQVRILAPRNNQKIRRGDVMVRLQVRNWELAQDPGNHVHLVVDNEPYIAIRDISRPLNLNALMQEHLGRTLEPGTHVLRVFPSRPQHESVKEARAFAIAVFHNQEETEGFEFDAAAPLLTYSRPKGCNRAGERVLLDFFVANVEGGLTEAGTKVRYTIDGRTTGNITKWQPHYIENLTPGEHTIRLQLLGADGQPAAGAFNDITRTIRVATECPPEPQQGAPAAGEEAEGATHGAAHGAGHGAAGAAAAGEEGAGAAATTKRARGRAAGAAGAEGGAAGGAARPAAGAGGATP